MPVTHIRTFRVRYYECDSNGHLYNANYLRYMQETAFDASAAVGYDKARYEAMGHIWLARENEIEYFAPLHYNDRVEIKTWVDDFRRVRSRRLYEFRLAGSDDLVARGSTDWVYVHADTFQPAVVPPEMIAAFAPDGSVKTTSRREPFPEPPPPPPGVFTMRKRPEWRDIDTAHHINNAAYLDYITELGMQAALFYGWPHTRMLEANFAIIARQHRIQYLRPAHLDDELELATWVSDLKRATCIRHYTIKRASDGELLTRIRSLWVFVDFTTGKPGRINPQFLQDFAPNVV